MNQTHEKVLADLLDYFETVTFPEGRFQLNKYIFITENPLKGMISGDLRESESQVLTLVADFGAVPGTAALSNILL